MQDRVLSSAWTFWSKFVFPPVWMFGFGAAAILVGLGGSNDRAMPLVETRFVFLAVWILGAALILSVNAGLKRVRMDERQLYVSNYFREIQIPFGAIVDVRQNRWLNSQPITIYFRDATEFGDKATFIPKQRIRFWRIDPVVEELKQLAGLTG